MYNIAERVLTVDIYNILWDVIKRLVAVKTIANPQHWSASFYGADVMKVSPSCDKLRDGPTIIAWFQSFSEMEKAACTSWGSFPGYYQHLSTFMKPNFSFLGHYCPRNTEFASQYPCPPGTYSEALNIWDASKCQLCPPGRVCSKPGLQRPDGLCTPGWFCPPGSMSSKPVFPGNHSGTMGIDQVWWLLLRWWYYRVT